MDCARHGAGARLSTGLPGKVRPETGGGMRRLICAALAAVSFSATHAIEAGGTRFDDAARLADNELVVNGAGVRKKAFFKVYSMALYLPAKQVESTSILALPGAKRVSITLLRDLSAQQFVDALNEGLVANHTEAEMAQLKARIQSFSETMLTIGEAKTGMSLDIDWLPGNGLRLSVAGQVRGKLIEGEDFYRALLRVWLGEKPVQADLKQALLGKGQ